MNTKILAVVTIALFAAPMAFATAADEFNGICQEFGFDFAVARWGYVEGAYTKTYELAGYSTSVTGNNTHADWTSSPAVDGVISREGQDTYLNAGGVSGSVDKHKNSNIRALLLCGNDVEIPEFGTLAAGVAITGALAGLVAFRKRN